MFYVKLEKYVGNVNENIAKNGAFTINVFLQPLIDIYRIELKLKVQDKNQFCNTRGDKAGAKNCY